MLGCRTRRSRLEVTLCALALGTLFALSGCHHHGRSRDTTVVAEADRFALSQELYSEYDEDWYEWNTTLDQARVEFRVRHFTEGWARIRIYDADGFEIFDETYHDHDYYYDGHYCNCDDEFTEVDFTAVGVPGEWLIQVEVADFSGSLYVSMD